MNDEILVPLDLSDAIAMIDRQKQQIAALTTENEELKQHLREVNPDYATDPRLVLREMDRIGKLEHFLAKLNAFSLDEDDDLINNAVPVDYILDPNGELETTGKLVKEAIKFMKEKEK